MYSFVVKQENIARNSIKRVSKKTELFNKKTKELMEKGYPRVIARMIIKSALNPIGEIGASNFSKTNLRKTRKERSKRLKVPFQANYNGPVFNQIWVKDEETGKLLPQFIRKED